MHRKLILALICQAIVPVITIVVPFSILALLLVLGETLPQEVLNANSINVTLHGKVCSILIIALTQPYRKFFLDQLKQVLK
ncbi:unnamed protein product, partial [Mesorhabditis belari]|uniref:Uncharacterized protein n=1 Tax=Mesorhabditis belari TaxID=2138241 RepID=A0AAF3ESC2_9BILA